MGMWHFWKSRVPLLTIHGKFYVMPRTKHVLLLLLLLLIHVDAHRPVTKWSVSQTTPNSGSPTQHKNWKFQLYWLNSKQNRIESYGEMVKVAFGCTHFEGDKSDALQLWSRDQVNFLQVGFGQNSSATSCVIADWFTWFCVATYFLTKNHVPLEIPLN